MTYSLGIHKSCFLIGNSHPLDRLGWQRPRSTYFRSHWVAHGTNLHPRLHYVDSSLFDGPDSRYHAPFPQRSHHQRHLIILAKGSKIWLCSTTTERDQFERTFAVHRLIVLLLPRFSHHFGRLRVQQHGKSGQMQALPCATFHARTHVHLAFLNHPQLIAELCRLLLSGPYF